MGMPSKKRTVAAQAAEMGPLPEMPRELIDRTIAATSKGSCAPSSAICK